MNFCDKCGQQNDPSYQFCRNCGSRIAMVAQQHNPDYAPPRPYAWKTDEYQTQSEPRANSLEPPYPQGNPYGGGQMMQQPDMRFMGGHYRCNYCGSSQLPILEKRVSSTGWIVFALLLVFTFFFFWIGLLIKEDVRICPNCRNKLN